VKCINRDHDATGTHDLDDEPIDNDPRGACAFPSCYAWAKATGVDPAFTAALGKDHRRNWGSLP